MKRLIGCTAALCLAALLAALTVGCGGTASSGTRAYVANSTGTGFTVFTVSQQGPLTNPTQQNTPAPPKMLQISANGKWAFFLDASGNNIYGFTRAGNGNFVDQIGKFPLTSSGSSIAITPNNKFLYAAIPATNEIAIFIIDQSTGQLTQLGSNKPVGAAIRQLAVAPDGLALYGLAPDQQEVLGFTIPDPNTGAATPSNSPGSVGPAPPCHGPNPPATCEGMILSSDGKFIYVPDTVQTTPNFITHSAGGDIVGNSPVIYGFSTSTNGVEGALQPIPGVIFNENADVSTGYPTVPVAGATTPNGRWLFIANQGSHNISVFDIHTLGGGAPLEVIGAVPSPFDCGTFTAPEVSCSTPSFIAVSKQNNAIYVLDTPAAKIFQLAIDQSTGRLRPLDPHSVDAGATPTWITIK